MSQANGGKWVTVKPKKEVKKPDGRDKQAKVAPADPVKAAFAALDNNWHQQMAGQAAESSRSAPTVAPSQPSPSTAGQYAFLRTSTPPASPKASQTAAAPEAVAQAQPKKPKVKKARVTLGQAAAQINLQSYQQFLQQLEQRYPDDQRSQLETVADYFLNTFKECDLAFNKVVLEQPLDKATDVPVQELPQPVTEASCSFFATKDISTLARFALVLINTVFEGVPESLSSKTAPPKAKVGLLLMLSLLLRAAPSSLLPICPDLLGRGRMYTSAGRLPFLLWVLSQTSRGDLGAGIAAWLRILLPQILGAELAATASKASAASSSSGPTAGGEGPPGVHKLAAAGAQSCLDYLDSLLGSRISSSEQVGAAEAAQRGYAYTLVSEGKTVPVHEAVVSPGALETLLRASFSTSSQVASAVRTRLQNRYEELRGMALAGIASGGFSASEEVKLALDTAALAEGNGADEELVQQATRNIVACLAASPAAGAAWESRHKHQLRGSTRVLQHLMATAPRSLRPLLRDAQQRTAFLQLLKTLQQRHRFHLQSGKGWQGAAARASDDACTQLTAKVNGSRGAGGCHLTSGVLLAALVGTALVLLSQNAHIQDLAHEVAQSEAFQAATAPLHDAAAKLAPYADDVNAKLRPYVADVSARVTPYWHQASERVLPYVHSVQEQAAPMLDRISTQLAALLHRAHSH